MEYELQWTLKWSTEEGHSIMTYRQNFETFREAISELFRIGQHVPAKLIIHNSNKVKSWTQKK